MYSNFTFFFPYFTLTPQCSTIRWVDEECCKKSTSSTWYSLKKLQENDLLCPQFKLLELHHFHHQARWEPFILRTPAMYWITGNSHYVFEFVAIPAMPLICGSSSNVFDLWQFWLCLWISGNFNNIFEYLAILAKSLIFSLFRRCLRFEAIWAMPLKFWQFWPCLWVSANQVQLAIRKHFNLNVTGASCEHSLTRIGWEMCISCHGGVAVRLHRTRMYSRPTPTTMRFPSQPVSAFERAHHKVPYGICIQALSDFL